MKKISTMLGLAIGDALGQPFEFADYKKIAATGWKGEFTDGLVWNLQPGQYTDDTKMALCIADSLLEHKGFNADQVSLKYIDWVNSGDLRGIGMTCERSIYNMISGLPLSECGKKSAGRKKPSFKRVAVSADEEKPDIATDFCGNGTVMRVAPIGSYYRNDLAKLSQAAKEDASMTHNHPDARDSSFALAHYIASLCNGTEPIDALGALLILPYEYPHVQESLILAIDCMDRQLSFADSSEIIGATGCAHSTLGSAMYAFISTSNFKDAVVKATLMGGDTDTRAAIAGAMAGAHYGLEDIPEEYLTVEDSERLQKLDQELCNIVA